MGKVLKKILVVEDNEDNREVFVYRLQRLGGFEVLVASNGKEALEIAARAKPNLIFMDLKMPIMDGWTATQAIRQTDWGKTLPVVAVTAYAMKGDRERALEAGCNDYITKPIMDYSLIQQKIEEFLGQ